MRVFTQVLIMWVLSLLMVGCVGTNDDVAEVATSFRPFLGRWVVDTKETMRVFSSADLGRWDAAMEVASYDGLVLDIRPRTLSMKNYLINARASYKTLTEDGKTVIEITKVTKGQIHCLNKFSIAHLEDRNDYILIQVLSGQKKGMPLALKGK